VLVSAGPDPGERRLKVSLDENHTWQHLGELVTRNMEKLKVPGVALGVLRDG
jgi:hypothetical protein